MSYPNSTDPTAGYIKIPAMGASVFNSFAADEPSRGSVVLKIALPEKIVPFSPFSYEHRVSQDEMDRCLKELFDLAKPKSKPVGPIHEKMAAGRNEPCPCGSGKKFKKCCR